MYLQIASAYYTHTTKISQEGKQVGLFQELEHFAKNMVEISESMSKVCRFFHAVIKLEKGHLFNPGTNIS